MIDRGADRHRADAQSQALPNTNDTNCNTIVLQTSGNKFTAVSVREAAVPAQSARVRAEELEVK
jgi:hypothetical protein